MEVFYVMGTFVGLYLTILGIMVLIKVIGG